jgi:hypothetical protein
VNRGGEPDWQAFVDLLTTGIYDEDKIVEAVILDALLIGRFPDINLNSKY